MKRKRQIKFTAHERRCLGLPQSVKQYGKGAKALRKIIDVFPWLLDVADHNYDQQVALCYIKASSAVHDLEMAKLVEIKKRAEIKK